jgi:hypothetical protein
MKYTKEQIDELRKALFEAQNKFRKALQECEHQVARRSDSAICEICNAVLGWYCDESPKGYCEYPNDLDDDLLTEEMCDDQCAYCGGPDERK